MIEIADDSPGRELLAAANLNPIKGTKGYMTHQSAAWFLAVAISIGWSAGAQDAPHLSITQPGGMPGMPVLTGITRLTNGVNVTWDGPSGYYQLFQKLNLKDSAWQALGTPYNLSRSYTVTSLSSNAFLRVSGPSPHYAGAQTCAECHSGVLNSVVHTAHFGAFTNALFASLGGQTNGACLACHSVGFGLPTGFISQAVTRQLAAVQCENCHGPAANHAANPDDPVTPPRVEVAGTMCGGCHNTQRVPAQVANLHPPFYEEWSTSPHQPVLEELKEDFASSAGLISTCGRCHSGTVREAFLENQFLPDAQEASAVGIACTTCHEPHGINVFSNVVTGVTYSNQLRNPVASLQDYHTTGDFTTNYNPQINVCAQCHNDRGASYKDTSRQPHHSPQYNMLIGTAGVLNTNNPDAPHFNPAYHAFAPKQCVTCHMQAVPYQSPSKLGTAGHTFGLITNSAACGGPTCHGVGDVANLLVPIVTNIITTNPDGLYPVHSISEVQSKLVEWAITKAPGILGTAVYGTNAWAYSNYSPPDPLAGGPGPSTNPDLQGLIPTNIKIARYNLYLVQNDGSFGAHNFNYTVDLLNTAYNLVNAELAK